MIIPRAAKCSPETPPGFSRRSGFRCGKYGQCCVAVRLRKARQFLDGTIEGGEVPRVFPEQRLKRGDILVVHSAGSEMRVIQVQGKPTFERRVSTPLCLQRTIIAPQIREGLRLGGALLRS